ncbi:MAG: ATP synthase F0 subunit B, partial [Armatimonadota bacterium]
MANPHESKSGSPIPGIVIGVVLMIGGMAVHRAVGRIEPVGIPLEPGKTVATIGVFMILFPVIKMFFLNPLNAAVGSRNQELERTFSEAESLRAEMGTLRKEYEARLAATEAQARETIQNQIREAQALRSSLRDEAQARADALVANAQNEVTAERTRLLSELRTHVTDLALAAAERVVGENMDTDRNRRIV